MDDFGNIIYVVGALAWFLWSAYKKSKEKAQPVAPTSERRSYEREEESRSFEDMIREQFGEPEPKPVLKPVKESNASKFLSTDLTHSHLPADYQMSQTEMKSHRVERQVRLALDQVAEEDENLMDNLFPTGFSMKQAIVLNAVLERPYR